MKVNKAKSNVDITKNWTTFVMNYRMLCYFYYINIFHPIYHVVIFIYRFLTVTILTLKEAGGGPKVPSGFSIGCHFSQDHAMVTKILDFIHIHPK